MRLRYIATNIDLYAIKDQAWTNKSKKDIYFDKLVKIIHSCQTKEHFFYTFKLILKFQLSWIEYPASSTQAIRLNYLVDLWTNLYKQNMIKEQLNILKNGK